MKFVLTFLASLTAAPTWHDYAQYNSRYTALLLDMRPYTKVTCYKPYPSGNSKCIVDAPEKRAYMLCPTHGYDTCEAWVVYEK